MDIDNTESNMKRKKSFKKIIDKINAYLNSKSLMSKFVITAIFVVIIPITVSCIIFSNNINRNYYKHEYDNLNYLARNKADRLKNMIEDDIAVSNVVASSPIIIELEEKRFGTAMEYYDYFVDNHLRDLWSPYVIQKQGVEDLKVFIKNDTILNGGIIQKFTDKEKETGWYKALDESGYNICLCPYTLNITGQDKETATGELVVARKLYRGRASANTIGYIVVNVNMLKLKEIVVDNLEYISFYIVNRKSGLVYAPSENVFYTDIGYIDDKLSNIQNIAVEEMFDGEAYLKDWSIVGIYDRSRIIHQQIINALLVVLVNALFALIMIFIIYIIHKSYIHRISKIIVSMKDMEHEIFEPVDPVEGTDEIGRLTLAYNHMVRKINTLINDVYKLEMTNKSIEVEKVRAELRSLQSQIDPHFIFNVLNAMLVVSVKNGYDEISPHISGLAKMIRRLLDWSDDREKLSTELDFIETYLKLEKFRFGDIFNYEINVNNNAEECNVPKMIVQPLIENACHHGLQGVNGERKLWVNADFNDNILCISVKDNGVGIPAQLLSDINEGLADEDFKGHIGVKNVYRRLKLYFHDNAQMQILSEEGKGTEIIITINYAEEDS